MPSDKHNLIMARGVFREGEVQKPQNFWLSIGTYRIKNKKKSNHR